MVKIGKRAPTPIIVTRIITRLLETVCMYGTIAVMLAIVSSAT